MLSLRDLQRSFLSDLRDDRIVRTASFVVGGRFSAEERLQIYRNNMTSSLTEALAALYPVVQRLVSEGFFAFLSSQYLRSHPSRSGNLHDFGYELPAFLESFQPSQHLSYLPDVARLEWGWHDVYHAADVESLVLLKLPSVAPADYGRLKFSLNPACRLLASPFPVLEIWRANQDEAEEQTVDLASGAEQLLIHRLKNAVRIRRLELAEFQLLQRIAGGDSVEDALANAHQVASDFDLQTFLQRHILQGTLADFTL